MKKRRQRASVMHKMSYRFKEPGHGMGPHSGPPDNMRDSMRSMGGPNDPKFDDGRMIGLLDVDKLSRDDMEGDHRGPRPPFGPRGRRLSPPREKSLGDRQRDFGYGRDDMPMHGRDRSPLRGGFDDRFPDRFKRDEMPFPRRDDHGRKDRFGDDAYRDKFMGGMDRGGRFERGPGGLNSRFDHPEEPLGHRPLPYPATPYKGYYKSDMMKPNECEIIVVNKQQRAYAENVEQRLKNLGIQVDILFLKDEALLVQTIDDIARRGSLYAIVISPLNETHRSVTLNILYGTPQEHRNMPLDDALKLVARNFHDYIRSQRELMDRDKSERGVYSGSFPADREIQFLLRLLADGRQVSLGEIDTVLRYLTERRDKMKGVAGDRGPAPAVQGGLTDAKMSPQTKPKDESEIAQKEQDLQNRIMNIMSQEATEDTSIGGPSKAPLLGNVPGMGSDISGSRPNQGPGPNLRDPSPSQAPVGQNQLNTEQNRPGMGMNRSGMNQNLPGVGQNQSGLSPATANANQIQPGPMGAGNVTSSGANPTSTSTNTYINFDNPSVKKALDSLMQSGPNLLKSLSGTASPSGQSMQNNSPANKMPPSNMGSGMGPQRGPGGIGDVGNMGPQRGAGGMGDMGPQRGPGGMGDMGQPRGPGDMGRGGPGDMGRGGPGDMGRGGLGDMGRGGPGDMGMRGGPGNMGDMGSRGMGDMGLGPKRGPGGMGDMGPQRGMSDMGSQRGPSLMGDMGPRGPGGMGDMGPRGPGGMGDMGPRGSGLMGDMGPRGPGLMGDMGPRGPGGMGDMGPRGPGGMDDMGNMGPQRGPGGMGGGGNMGPQRGPGGMGSAGNMGMQRGLGNMGDGNMGPGMDSGNMGPLQGMGGRPGPNMGGPGPRSGGMGPGSQFQGPQGMFGNSPNMMGNRPPYMGGHMGGQGMGGGPRRY